MKIVQIEKIFFSIFSIWDFLHMRSSQYIQRWLYLMNKAMKQLQVKLIHLYHFYKVKELNLKLLINK